MVEIVETKVTVPKWFMRALTPYSISVKAFVGGRFRIDSFTESCRRECPGAQIRLNGRRIVVYWDFWATKNHEADERVIRESEQIIRRLLETYDHE